ncbi:hypothetical protein DMUE_5065 [Dictyocoela muelleri]|nr:hypothetical protein DMUE_5065 [Dictyocoela muelleri]
MKIIITVSAFVISILFLIIGSFVAKILDMKLRNINITENKLNINKIPSINESDSKQENLINYKMEVNNKQKNLYNESTINSDNNNVPNQYFESIQNLDQYYIPEIDNNVDWNISKVSQHFETIQNLDQYYVPEIDNKVEWNISKVSKLKPKKISHRQMVSRKTFLSSIKSQDQNESNSDGDHLLFD